MELATLEPIYLNKSLNSKLLLYKQEQKNLKQCREKIIEFADELNVKDAIIRNYEASTETSTRYISRLESVNVGLKDQLIEEKTKTKSLEIEHGQLKLELEKLRQNIGDK